MAKLIELVQEADDDAPAARPKQEHEIIADSLASSSEPPAAPTPTPTPTPAPAPAPAPAAHQHERQPSPLVQDMTVLSDEDERAGVPFEEDLEALFETCVHSQAMFGVC